MQGPIEDVLWIVVLRHPSRARREFHSDKVTSTDQSAIPDMSRQSQFSHSQGQLRVDGKYNFCLDTRPGGRYILQHCFETVRPAQLIAPKELDDVGAEIALFCAPFVHAESIGGTPDQV